MRRLLLPTILPATFSAFGQKQQHNLKKITLNPETCTTHPQFSPEESFFVIHCPDDETSATITFEPELKGDVILDGAFKKVDPYYGISIDLSQEDSAALIEANVCPNEHELNECNLIHFDVYRFGENDGLLGMLSVQSGGQHGAHGSKLIPAFDPYTFNYTADVNRGEDFEIMAVAQHQKSSVGIEFSHKRSTTYSNDCMHADRRHEMWKFPQVEEKPEMFIICAVVPNKKKFHTYYVTINPRTVLSARAKTIRIGSHKLVPQFSPNITNYKLTVPLDTKTLQVSVEAENPEAKVSIGNQETRVTSTGSGEYTLHMPKNPKSVFSVFRPPQWTRQFPIRIKVTDPDDPTRFFLQDYLVTAAYDVSRYAKLKDLTLTDSACKLTPAFDKDIFDYSCVWNWDDSETVTITPTIDSTICHKCRLRTVDPKAIIAGHSHLNVVFRHEKKVYWDSGKRWKKDLLFGEYHVVPIMVLSEDQYSHHTYKIYIERAAPWWMRTTTTRFISTSATTLAIITTGSMQSFMALVKQMQFMTLTTDIEGCPPVYEDYVKNLSNINLDLGRFMPNWLGGLSPKSIKAYKDRLIHEMKMEGKFCKKKKQEGMEAAMKFAKEHHHVFYSRRLGRTQMAPFFRNSTDDERKRMLSNHFFASYQERHLSEVQKTAKLKDIDCKSNREEAIKHIEKLVHDLQELAKLLHGVLGNLVFITFFLIVTLSSYWSYYYFIFRKQQTRLRSLEPGQLWLFVLDYGLIMFTSSACKLMFRPDTGLHLFGVTPAPWLIAAVCFLAILSYPMTFLCGVTYFIKNMQDYDLVWNKDLEEFSDVQCHNIKVTVDPPIPAFVPIFSQIFTQHARGCIPILDEDGKPIVCRPERKPKLDKDGNPMLDEHGNPILEDEIKLGEKEKGGGGNGGGKHKMIPELNKELKDQMEHLLEETVQDYEEYKEELRETTQRKTELSLKQTEVKMKQIAKMGAMDAEIRQQQKESGDKGVAPEWVVECFKEIPEKWNWMKQLKEEDLKEQLLKSDRKGFKARVEDKEAYQDVIEMRDSWKSAKGRPDDDKLEEEERYAMVQYIDQFIREERRLHKYNILRIVTENGYLKPRESPEEEFIKGKHYIENDLQERLIYPGDEPVSFPSITPGGKYGGTLQWRKEPSEGWAAWEKKMKEGSDSNPSSEFYANKWQYACFDYPAKPWFQDEEADVKSFLVSIIPPKLLEWWRKRFAGRVARNMREMNPDDLTKQKDMSEQEKTDISEQLEEIKEIKKWFWVELQPYMQMKMRLGNFAQQHVKYFRDRSLVELASQDFHTVWKEIEMPSMSTSTKASARGADGRDDGGDDEKRSWDMDRGGEEDDLLQLEGSPRASPRRASAARQAVNERKRKQMVDDALHGTNRELSDYVLMRYEDLHEEKDEPWWRGCDEEIEGEIKCTMDDDEFFAELNKNFLANNPHIPRQGYSFSTVFTQYPEQNFAKKRYNLMKPDSNRCNVEVNIKLKHVLPAMRYVPRFKVNVLQEDLDMPMRMSWRIVLKDKTRDQKYLYVIDRFATLVSILALSARMGAGVQVLGFFLARSLTMGYQMSSDYYGLDQQKEELQKDGTKKLVGKPQPRFFSFEVFLVFMYSDVFQAFMQTFTLLLLFVGLLHITNAPLTALLCILATSFTMVWMNMRSYGEQFKKMIREAGEKAQALKAKALALRYRIQDYWDTFMGKKRAVSSEFYSAQKIDLIVPEIGAEFEGEPEVDQSLPPEEQREAGMKKQLMYYSASMQKLKHLKYSSVKATDRFELDIKTGMTFVMDTDQLCLRKKMPAVVATIQCVNHAGEHICSPQYDSFLTLTKPSTWEEEDDDDTEKMSMLIKSWNEEVQSWLVENLGAMRTDRTGTSEIMKQIGHALESEFGAVGTTARKLVKVKLISCQGVPKQLSEMGNQDFYVALLKESENPEESYPKERISNTITGTWENDAQTTEGCSFNDEVLQVEVRSGDLFVQFSVWDEDLNRDDFVGFTEPVNIEDLTSEYGDPMIIYLMRKGKNGHEVIASKKSSSSSLMYKKSTSMTSTNFGEDDENVFASITVQMRLQTDEESREDINRRSKAREFVQNNTTITNEKVKALPSEEMDDMMQALDIRMPRQMAPSMKMSQQQTGGEKAENTRKTRMSGGKPIEVEDGWDDDPSLVQKVTKALVQLQKQGDKSQKRVLHYVILSDHLKPNKKWKPDPITPHVAQLIVKEVVVVRELMLQGCEGGEYDFMNGIYEKMEHHVNGRAAYKHRHHERYIYFDGKEKWLISPDFNKGLRPEPGYFFAPDQKAQSPNMLDQPFSVWDGPGQAWQCVPNMYVYEYESAEDGEHVSWFYKKFFAKTHESPFVIRQDTPMDKALKVTRFVLQKTRQMLTVPEDDGKNKNYTLRECLVSLSAAGVTFRWKDMNIEYLKDFRKFLLTNFETYERAWTVAFARDMKIPADSAAKQIRTILSTIEDEKYQDLRTDFDPDQVVNFIKDPEGDFVTVNSAKILYGHNVPQEFRKFVEFLREVSLYDVFEAFWAKLSCDEGLTKEEFYHGVKDLLVSFKDKELREFKRDLIPDFREKERRDPTEQEIHDATEKKMRAESDKLFVHFDAQDSGDISFQEMIPASGDQLKDVGTTLLPFQIPIEYLHNVVLDPKRHRVTLHGNSKLVDQDRWTKLKLALDPDWKLEDRENESIQFIVRDAFYDVWKSVTKTSDMQQKQEFIMLYDGMISEHPKISGTFIRQGTGVQRWSDGRIYEGNWQDHVPHGEGKLWRSEKDSRTPDMKPIYEGQWKNGRRHGEGVLRWEQRTQDNKLSETFKSYTPKLESLFSMQKGIRKIYKGQFKDDLFCGEGELYVENGNVAKVIVGDGQKDEEELEEKVPRAQIDPSQIIVFKGIFHSDWEQTRSYVSKHYRDTWEDLDLKIRDIIASEDETKRTGEEHAKYQRYLASKNDVQLPGAAPMDFAVNLYSHKAGEKLHFWEGTVEYADDSVYEGCLDQGLPNGQGKLFQTRPKKKNVSLTNGIGIGSDQEGGSGEFEVLQEYDGEWKFGLKHGRGWLNNHITGLVYDGQWKDDKKHGQGKITIPPSLVDAWGYRSYEGEWKNNKRAGEGKLVLKNHTQYEGQFENNQRVGKGVLRECVITDACKETITLTYACPEEAHNDLIALYGGGGQKMVFVDHVWKPRRKDEDGGKKAGKKSKKKEENEEEEDMPPGAGKAVNAGVQEGMYIVSINGSEDFEQVDPINELFTTTSSFFPADKELVIVCAWPKDSLYCGMWKHDKCFTTEERPAWLLLEDERLYYGQVSTEGKRDGFGILFAHTKGTCPKNLLQDWHLGNTYRVPEDMDEKNKHEFITYEGDWKDNLPHGKGKQYAQKATYEGDFEKGMRHGRGIFTATDGSFRYLPGGDEQQLNFCRDQMHGVGTVEQREFIHSNVIFKEGKCITPYVEAGPPTSGFHDSKLMGPAVNKLKSSGGLFGQTLETTKLDDASTDVDFNQSASKDKFQASMKTHLRRHEDRHMIQPPSKFSHVIHEPTDFMLTESDVLVYGGTGPNELMNGLYYRKMGTFGVTVFMHYTTNASNEPIERYLFQSLAGTQWIIGPDPDKKMLSKEALEGTAWVQSSEQYPENIVGSWNVYYNPLNKEGKIRYQPYRKQTKEEILAKIPPIDKIKIQIVEGFVLCASSSDGILDGVFLRQPEELYDRPVYELENGGQFLFWNPISSNDEGAGSSFDEKTPLHEQKGAWMIADHLVARPKDHVSGCWAYSEDSAVTPDLIRAGWMSYVNEHFMKDEKFDLHMHDKSSGAPLDVEQLMALNTSLPTAAICDKDTDNHLGAPLSAQGSLLSNPIAALQASWGAFKGEGSQEV